MLRIVMISPLPPQKTGESPYTAKLISKLADIAEIEIYAITGTEAEELPDRDGRVHTIPIWEGRDLVYPFRLLNSIRQIKPHLVHVQFGPDKMIYGGMFGEVMLLLLILLRLCGIPTTVTSHSTWMKEQVKQRVTTYPKLGIFSSFAKVFFTAYMKLLDWGTNTIQLSTVRIDSLLRKKFLNEYDISKDKILEIPHPCAKIKYELDQQEAQSELELEGREIILTFGFIKRGKGLEKAVRAVDILSRNHPKILLLIAGKPLGNDGEEYLSEIKELVKLLSLEDNVRFDAQYIPTEDVPKYFSASSVILVPYTESIGASGPIHNFAGYGKPIVASDVGYHNCESLGGSVVVYSQNDVEDLAKKIDRILQDKSYAERIGAAHKKCSEKQTWEEGAKQTLRNYRTTLKR